MIAALPMYDRPELRAATDRLWQAIQARLNADGIAAPPELTRNRDLWEMWRAPDLILAQTCGLPYRARLHAAVTLVATPDYALPGCPPGYYNSVIVARDTTPGPRAAVNDPLSQSGWAALIEWARGAGHALTVSHFTGGHAASAQAVLEGRADLAAIDAQTWRLLRRFEPWAAGLSEIARTAPTPGLPLITAPSQDPQPIRRALDAALTDLTKDDRAALGLAGFPVLAPADYLALPIPPKAEAGAHY